MPQFSDAELDQIKHFGQALGSGPTDFDEEVEKHLRAHEANYAKMRAAQMGGELGSEQDGTISDSAAQRSRAAGGNAGRCPGPASPRSTDCSASDDGSQIFEFILECVRLVRDRRAARPFGSLRT
jgi:hypothetical protein